MQKVGILGGLGPEATMIYYQDIIKGFQKRLGRQDVLPELTINSVNMYHLFGLLNRQDNAGAAAYLGKGIAQLAQAGVDFVAMCGMTPHIVFDQLQAEAAVPLLSMVQTSVTAAQAQKFTKLGLFGTKFTMSHDFATKPFETQGITMCLPNQADQAYIHEKIEKELENGIVKPATKQQLLKVANNLIQTQQIQGLVLGCTELPLIIQPNDLPVPAFDIAQIHIQAIVDRIFQ
ncbi:aspartate racemase [Agrilactobacillus composti DSM 18527 = JCM 14202]|uniref:Aspartate racemase n=1 Tax=Agrilactobacillus composti DSM 18527 = JCM 14202 TaxID=1423734 RepID=X0QJ34_9LACO|nr:amino acid racemase [Agrilactobacillus composti]KRM33044.1 aspartate racemase [Agrilactobacillus composti DSM 18527 = JCM 14202]GAF38610.1 aspartate racemase [Agrilactobacillus composti DSM 18527 = JCM 14202]